MPKNNGGARRVDDRRVISGIIQILKGYRNLCGSVSEGPFWTDFRRSIERCRPSRC